MWLGRLANPVNLCPGYHVFHVRHFMHRRGLLIYKYHGFRREKNHTKLLMLYLLHLRHIFL